MLITIETREKDPSKEERKEDWSQGQLCASWVPCMCPGQILPRVRKSIRDVTRSSGLAMCALGILSLTWHASHLPPPLPCIYSSQILPKRRIIPFPENDPASNHPVINSEDSYTPLQHLIIILLFLTTSFPTIHDNVLSFPCLAEPLGIYTWIAPLMAHQPVS